MKRFMTRKVVTIGIAAGLTLGIAGAALAYFTATGSGTGHGTVGTSSPLAVNVSACTGPALVPGVGTQLCDFTVVNTAGNGSQSFTTTSAALTTDAGGGVYDTTSAAFVDGCQASWFDVSVTTQPTPTTLADGGSATGGVVTLTMPANTTTNQNPCKTLTPQITVSAS
jgi:hypothetical protein